MICRSGPEKLILFYSLSFPAPKRLTRRIDGDLNAINEQLTRGREAHVSVDRDSGRPIGPNRSLFRPGAPTVCGTRNVGYKIIDAQSRLERVRTNQVAIACHRATRADGQWLGLVGVTPDDESFVNDIEIQKLFSCSISCLSAFTVGLRRSTMDANCPALLVRIDKARPFPK